MPHLQNRNWDKVKQDSEMMIWGDFFFPFLFESYMFLEVDASISLKHAVAHKSIQEAEAGSIQGQPGI